MTQAEIGKRIAEERKAQGISIRELARRCDISTTTLQGVEKGWYEGRLATYLKIAENLKMNLQITNTEHP